MKIKYYLLMIFFVIEVKFSYAIYNNKNDSTDINNVSQGSNKIILTLETGTTSNPLLLPVTLAATAANTSYIPFIDPATRSLNTSYLAGTTSGSINVSKTGSASYCIPIKVMPGANGFEPSITIEYSSNIGYGIAGYGWQIGGISMVTRSGQNFYNDRAVTGVNLSTSDRFQLNGQRLVLTSGTYGANANYKTESDNFSYIESTGTTGSGPEKFLESTNNGIENLYGYTNDSKLQIPGYGEILTWYISQKSDIYGNIISYTYLRDNNLIYPYEINYGPNKISFTYTSRTDVTSSYVKGQKLQETLLLDKISVSYNSNTVRTYQFNYNLLSNNYNNYSLLNEIVEFGTGTYRLNSTVFSYQTPANVSFTQSNNYFNYDKISYPTLIYTGEFNGDGKADLLCVKNTGGIIMMPSGNQSINSNESLGKEDKSNLTLPNYRIGWIGMKMYYSDGNDNFSNDVSSSNEIDTGKLLDLQLLDINGDGKDDILYVMYNLGNSMYYYMLNNGTSFGDPVLFSQMTYGIYAGLLGKERRINKLQQDDNILQGLDFNGDGVNDIFAHNSTGDWVIYSFGNTVGQLTTTLNQLGNGNLGPSIIETLSGDFNGDGKPEIWIVESTGIKIYSFNGSNLDLIYTSTQATSDHFFTLGDFNADGKTDIFIYGNKTGGIEYDWGNWQVQLSTGTGFELKNIPQKKANLKNDYVRLGDFNGDGSTDIMATSKDQTWTGTCFFITKNRGTDFYSQNITTYPNEKLNYYVADFNGDGRSDYMCTGVLGTTWSGYQIYKSTGNTTPLLEKVANGLNHLTTVSYSKLSQAGSSVYQQGTAPAFPVFNYQGGMPVVTTLTSNNGTGSSNSLTFYYEGAKVHRQGKGFLCYSKMTDTDATLGLINESLSDYQNTYFYPRTTCITKKTTGGSIIETMTQNWTQVEIDAPLKLIDPYVQSNTTTNALTGHSVTTTYTYNDRGKLTYQTKNFNNGVTEILQFAYLGASRPLIWRPRIVDYSTITYLKSGEASVTNTVRYTYATDGVTKPDVNYYFEGTPLAYTYNNDYNSKGNLLKTVISGTSIGTSEINYTYDAAGIRTLTSTDALGHVTTNTFDTYGRIYTTADYLNNTNTYGYDALGRQISVSNNNGNQITTQYVWAGANKPSLGVFGSIQTGNDGSVVISWFDKLGRTIRTEKKGFGGLMILTDTEYNIKGQVYRVSDPYFAGGSIDWAETYSYDGFGRVSSIVRNTGRNTTFTYSANRITETTGGKTTWKETDSQGLLTKAHDNGGDILYSYYPDGKIKSISAPGNALTTMQYADAARNQTQLSDPSSGTISYSYDALGRIKTQTNGRNQTTTFQYLPDGRADYKTSPEGTTTFSYNSNKQLTGIANSTSGISRSYGYDSKGRIINIAESIAGSNFSVSFTYDSFGRLGTKTHASGITETFGYNSNGYLATISAGGATRFTMTSMNARQQLTGATYGSNLAATYGFDAYGYPISTSVGNIQDYRYSFNIVTGNLNSRQNFKRNLFESFSYTDNGDNLDRLTSVSGPQNLSMTYAANGNILTKSDISSSTAFTYGAGTGPYALTGATSSTGVIPAANQSATYTSSEMVNTVTEGAFSASFKYNTDNQRAKMDIAQNGSNIMSRWYFGTSYMKELAGGTSKEYTYIGGNAYTAPVVAVTQNGTTSYYYLLRDYLGNITHLVNTSNMVVAEYNFDAWGRRRSADDWSYVLDAGDQALFAGRGFTSHEFLPWFNLYNMNGRLYDPLVGRFLSPDPYIQAPAYSQNYNRYSYCLNNPLRFTDPSGYRMAPADKYWNLDKELTNFDRFYGYSDSGNNGGSGGGWGGNGGVLPGWYTPAGSYFGNNLYRASNILLGSISDNEQYDLTGMDYMHGIFKFTFRRNAIASKFLQDKADFDMRRKIGAAANIGYGKSFTDYENIYDGYEQKDGTPAGQGGKNVPGGDWDFMGKGSVPYNGKAWFGTNFVGPGPDVNPYTLKLRPVDAVDKAAQRHDYYYWKEGASGIQGALFNKNVAYADAILATDAYQIMQGYKTGAIDQVTGFPISERTYNIARGVYYLFTPLYINKVLP